MNCTIEIRKTGICDTGAEAVVNAANSGLQRGGGVCGAIFAAAGASQLQKECDLIGYCETGKAVITSGYELCDHIVHAVGPIYEGGTHNEEELLKSAYRSSLDLIRSRNCRSCSFPLISSGIYGYPKKEAWQCALKACDEWRKNNDEYELQIIFAVLDDEVLELGRKCAADLDIEII